MRPALRRNPCIALAAMLVLIGAGPAGADQINAAGRTYVHGRVAGLSGGFITFREDGGQAIQLPIEWIERLFIDSHRGMDDFNQAEELFAAGDFARSIVPYERAMRSLTDGYWPDLVACRLMVANDRAGRLDRAVSQFVRALRGRDAGPSTVARIIPTHTPQRRDESTARAVETLDEALRSTEGELHGTLLRLLRYRILAALDDPRAEAERVAVVSMPLPAMLRTRQVYDILIEALAVLLKSRTDPADLAQLDRAITEAPPIVLPDLLLLKGRTLVARAKSREDLIRGAWPLMRVAIHMPDDPRAAAGLYETALVMERLERPDKALRLLEECSALKIAEDDVKAAAARALTRLRGATP